MGVKGVHGWCQQEPVCLDSATARRTSRTQMMSRDASVLVTESINLPRVFGFIFRTSYQSSLAPFNSIDILSTVFIFTNVACSQAFKTAEARLYPILSPDILTHSMNAIRWRRRHVTNCVNIRFIINCRRAPPSMTGDCRVSVERLPSAPYGSLNGGHGERAWAI